ncbi:hypothetical protein [Bosea sp. (in: a-proteobacteria)]|uniref:hypothetical protein n=1 Tax=Bosea sp. (in: a-proteobacteria) TaxID=1871050 RepID=UPI002602860F|nr:hypothetical protein [Bosea sp. (in: a-proteobacteria)]MCO5089886.1 hypothetical protein [Bosea sp. (in: a-proteobacteria)]
MSDELSKQRQVAVFVAEAATPSDLDAIKTWAGKLLEIRASSMSKLAKAKAAVSLTAPSKVVWPVAKMVAKEAKRIGWDDRSKTARLGLGGAAVGAAVFGGKSAGIAALGTAVGVPLWVVLGAGASFANVLIEEVTRRKTKINGASYTVIDAERVDPS